MRIIGIGIMCALPTFRAFKKTITLLAMSGLLNCPHDLDAASLSASAPTQPENQISPALTKLTGTPVAGAIPNPSPYTPLTQTPSRASRRREALVVCGFLALPVTLPVHHAGPDEEHFVRVQLQRTA